MFTEQKLLISPPNRDANRASTNRRGTLASVTKALVLVCVCVCSCNEVGNYLIIVVQSERIDTARVLTTNSIQNDILASTQDTFHRVRDTNFSV